MSNLFIISILTSSIFASSSGLNIFIPTLSQEQTQNQQQEVTIMIMLDDQGDPPRLLRMLFDPALQELQTKHPELNIKLDYRPMIFSSYECEALLFDYFYYL